MSYGSKEDGGYNAESLAYKANPSIELYVELRRRDPSAEIEVKVVGGIDQLFFLEPELRRYGFDPAMVASVLDANPDAISEVSLQIMEKMIEARRFAGAGETHLMRRGLVVPDKLINWLITAMLDALSWNDHLELPRDLIVLIRERLGGSNPEYEQASRAHEARWDAMIVGGQLLAQGVSPSYRMLGKILGVAPSTVMRWFPNGDFMEEVTRISGWFNADGTPKPLEPLKRHPLQPK